MNQNKEEFFNRFNFPGVIGAIDCTHIAILKPKVNAHNFLNRKGYHSINTQVICNADLKFLAVNANYPGSHHDAFIWRQSQIRQYLLNEFRENNLRGCWLIGDSGYPLESVIMTPYANPVPNSPEGRFNIAHASARNTVERAIGLLKTRFRCLLKERVARYDPTFVGNLINACVTLHNMCLEFGVNIDEDVEINFNHEPNEVMHLHNQQHGGLLEGQRVRNNITINYFNN